MYIKNSNVSTNETFTQQELKKTLLAFNLLKMDSESQKSKLDRLTKEALIDIIQLTQFCQVAELSAKNTSQLALNSGNDLLILATENSLNASIKASAVANHIAEIAQAREIYCRNRQLRT
jgi:hypothetical protein